MCFVVVLVVTGRGSCGVVLVIVTVEPLRLLTQKLLFIGEEGVTSLLSLRHLVIEVANVENLTSISIHHFVLCIWRG